MRKLLLLFLIFFASPLTAFASTQVIIGGAPLGNGGFALDAHGYNGSVRGSAFANNATIWSTPGVISNLIATTTYALTGTQTFTFNITKNGTDQSFSCVVNSSGKCADTTHSTTVAAGDEIEIHATAANAPAGTNIGFWSFDFVPTTDNQSVVPFNNDQNAPSATVTNYNNIGYYRISWGTTEASSSGGNPPLYWPDAGTFSKFYYDNSGTLAGAGKSFALTFRKNQTSGTLTATVDNTGSPTAGKTNDTTHSDSVTVGDLLDIQSIPSGTPSVQTFGAGYQFVPTTSGDFVFSGGNWNSVSAATFLTFTGTTGSTTESGAQFISRPMTVKSFVVMCAAAPGAAKTSVFTLRQNGANSSLSCTLSGASQTQCTATGSVVVANNDLLSYGRVNNGSATFCQVNAVGNNTPVVTTIHSKVILALGTWIIGLGKIIIQ